MKNIYTLIVQCMLVLFINSCASYSAKENGLSAILLKTQKDLNLLGEKIKTTNDLKLKEAYTNLKEKSSQLFPMLEKCNDKYSLKPDYISTLQETERALNTLLNEFESTTNKAFIINAVSQDYDAKLKTIQNTAKNDATTKIKVVVNSNEEEGFFVYGKLSFEQTQEIKRYRFNKPTQNASLDFVPGYYLFWLEKDNRVSEPELHLIMSSSGEEERKLVLKTPK